MTPPRPRSAAPSLLLALPLLLGTPLWAQATDDFEGGANQAGWSFNVTTPDVVESSGGNPGGWLHNPGVFSFAPIATSDEAVPSAFQGDFRAQGVTEIRVDAITLAASLGAAGRELSLLLRDTKGTPGPDDDDYAYFVGDEVPQPGAGWKSFVFPVPSASTAPVPAGWSGGHSGDLENFRPGVDWNDVITQVDRVELWWIDPSFFALIQDWDVGIDNVALQVAAPVPALPGASLALLAGLLGLAAAGLLRRLRVRR